MRATFITVFFPEQFPEWLWVRVDQRATSTNFGRKKGSHYSWLLESNVVKNIHMTRRLQVFLSCVVLSSSWLLTNSWSSSHSRLSTLRGGGCAQAKSSADFSMTPPHSSTPPLCVLASRSASDLWLFYPLESWLESLLRNLTPLFRPLNRRRSNSSDLLLILLVLPCFNCDCCDL